MDPFSLSLGVITVVTAAKDAIELVQKVRETLKQVCPPPAIDSMTQLTPEPRSNETAKTMPI
jgi:hypothetical protein